MAKGKGSKKAVLPGTASNQPNLKRSSSTSKTRPGQSASTKSNKFGGLGGMGQIGGKR